MKEIFGLLALFVSVVVGKYRCHEAGLERREESANVIFTGTVRGVYPDFQHPDMKKAQVEVKRIIKGLNVINTLSGINPYNPRSRKMVMVDGIGDPHICDSRARKYDTRIFLLNKEKNGELKLNSSLVRLTLRNLERTDAVVKGEHFKAPPLPTRAPCELKYCAFGGECVVDGGSGEARCVCPATCPDTFAPVCGSDSVTYTSECELRATSCAAQKRIKVKRHGECNVPDPCAAKKCSFGAKCVPSLDGLTSRCQCPQRCDHYGDSVDSRPVCGTDGNDYANRCRMQKAACAAMMEIDVKYYGQCDPCREHRCLPSQVCRLKDDRTPECFCNVHCEVEFAPVCATNGRTYSNRCFMKMDACKFGKNLHVMAEGECTPANNPCHRLNCTNDEECMVDRNGRARCECPAPCEPVLRPVCGSDGQRYDNECELRRHSCLFKLALTVDRCNKDGPCKRHKCDYHATCIERDGRAHCECRGCTEEFKPVCGTDGISYDNLCKMKADSCENKKTVNVNYQGLCNDEKCRNKECDFYSSCQVVAGKAVCVCPDTCVQVNDPVCGTDGVTYSNQCEMQLASCNKRQYIIKASRGPCDLCANVRCSYGARCEDGHCVCPQHCPEEYALVCASNGQEYDNECEMKRYACAQSLDLEKINDGVCEGSGSGDGGSGVMDKCDDITCRFGGKCEYNNDGDMICKCNLNCEAIRSKVCGSDGSVYVNECQMREESCRRQVELYRTPMDNCDGDMDDELCDGSPPMRDPFTNREYDCGNGRDTCPARSYCHRVEGEARCCQEEPPIRSCADTKYGCCPDGKTSAPGPRNAGCPSICQCHPLGSFSMTCDPTTSQCTCKPGVGSRRCDRCEPGFWDFRSISEGGAGCSPCQCNLHGSARDDCEQMTGRCVCKAGYTGQKCNVCPNGKPVGPYGNCEGHLHQARSCREIECQFGATCQMKRGVPTCQCPSKCPRHSRERTVCGNDGQEYQSACELQRFACRLQKPISVAYSGPCRDDVTPSPIRGKTTRDVAGKVTADFERTTAQPGYGILGDFCRSDSDCYVRDSYCKVSQCRCRGTHVPSKDNMHCREPMHVIPSFIGKSFLRITKFRQGTSAISIEMMFKTFNNDAILLYAAQSMDGKGDFVSLAVREGFVEFRYNLGSGPAIIKSAEKVVLNTFHRVVARRKGKEGMLMLDEGRNVAGSSPGNLESLNLKTDVYLGYVPNAAEEVFKDIGVSQGLVGCIESLELKDKGTTKTYNLMDMSNPDIVEESDIDDCRENPCSTMPCQNGAACSSQENKQYVCACPEGFRGKQCELSGEESPCNPNPCEGAGTCIPLLEEDFFCSCPPGRHGDRCESESSGDITVPEFHGDSHVEIKLNNRIGRSLAYKVLFMSTKPDGVLLYSKQENKEKGDFISLNLVRGYLQFRFDLGSGMANITSKRPVSLGEWHSVEIARSNQAGSMVVDAGDVVKGNSQGGLRELNLPMKLFVGGYPGGEYHPSSGVSGGLDGAVQQVYEGTRLVDGLVKNALSKNAISQYNGPPCPTSNNPCRNGGTCMPMLNEYMCECEPGFTGKHCEKASGENAATDGPLSFDGFSHQSYPNKGSKQQNSQNGNDVKIKFRTSEPSGLLVLQHKSATVDADYLAIALTEGYVEVSYNLGKQSSNNLFFLRSDVSVDDGEWHTLTFNREKRQGSLSIDDGEPVSAVSVAGATQLDTDGVLWLAGSPSPPRGLPTDYTTGFNGCIASVIVEGTEFDMVQNRFPGGSSLNYCPL